MKIYLDVCCLNRPFDNWLQDRVRLESEAVLTILTRYQIRNWSLLISEVTHIEISKIPDEERRQKVQLLSSLVPNSITVDKEVEHRAIELEQLGFGSFDALHVACAEKGSAEVLLTTDDDLFNKGLRYRGILKVRIENPTRWLMEVIQE